MKTATRNGLIFTAFAVAVYAAVHLCASPTPIAVPRPQSPPTAAQQMTAALDRLDAESDWLRKVHSAENEQRRLLQERDKYLGYAKAFESKGEGFWSLRARHAEQLAAIEGRRAELLRGKP